MLGGSGLENVMPALALVAVAIADDILVGQDHDDTSNQEAGDENLLKEKLAGRAHAAIAAARDWCSSHTDAERPGANSAHALHSETHGAKAHRFLLD